MTVGLLTPVMRIVFETLIELPTEYDPPLRHRVPPEGVFATPLAMLDPFAITVLPAGHALLLEPPLELDVDPELLLEFDPELELDVDPEPELPLDDELLLDNGPPPPSDVPK